MYCYDIQVVLQEVPGEISICFSISGCTLACEGCHSPYLWKEECGFLINDKIYKETLQKYWGLATNVLFMGGEWHPDSLIHFLKIARDFGYKTCLYTGLETVSDEILQQLTWVKVGAWKQHLGGLDSIQTNQRFIDLSTLQVLNHLFIK